MRLTDQAFSGEPPSYYKDFVFNQLAGGNIGAWMLVFWQITLDKEKLWLTDLCKIDVLKLFAIFTGKQLRSVFQ